MYVFEELAQLKVRSGGFVNGIITMIEERGNICAFEQCLKCPEERFQ